MDAVDTNILVYAHRAHSPWHAPADRFVQALAAAGVRGGAVHDARSSRLPELGAKNPLRGVSSAP